MAFPWMAAAVAGTGVLNWFSAKDAQSGQEQANQLSIDEAEKNRQWQQMMSSTSHQREVDDLLAAGLNPLLSANHGAPMGQGATAQNIKNPKEVKANILSNTSKNIAEIGLLNQKMQTEKQITKQAQSAAEVQEADAYWRKLKSNMEKTWFGKYVLAPLEMVLERGVGAMASGAGKLYGINRMHNAITAPKKVINFKSTYRGPKG
jgi:hypothetical protein